MILSEKETTVIKDLQTQEQCCVEKYERYSKLAKDQVLIDLFTDLHGKEQKHLESLTQVLSGKVPSCDCNDSDGKDYNPAATYSMAPSEDKKTDCFLATDCIGTEKLVSSSPGTTPLISSNRTIPGTRPGFPEFPSPPKNEKCRQGAAPAAPCRHFPFPYQSVETVPLCTLRGQSLS